MHASTRSWAGPTCAHNMFPHSELQNTWIPLLCFRQKCGTMLEFSGLALERVSAQPVWRTDFIMSFCPLFWGLFFRWGLTWVQLTAGQDASVQFYLYIRQSCHNFPSNCALLRAHRLSEMSYEEWQRTTRANIERERRVPDRVPGKPVVYLPVWCSNHYHSWHRYARWSSFDSGRDRQAIRNAENMKWKN